MKTLAPKHNEEPCNSLMDTKKRVMRFELTIYSLGIGILNRVLPMKTQGKSDFSPRQQKARNAGKIIYKKFSRE